MLATAKAASPKTQKCLKPHGTSGFRHYSSIGHCIKDGVNIDPCCGSGGMFVQSAKFIQAHSGRCGAISVYGQESNADAWKMAKMNLVIRGFEMVFV